MATDRNNPPLAGVNLLIDPDKWSATELEEVFANRPCSVSSIVVGGTYIHSDRFDSTMAICRRVGVPVGNFLSVGPIDSLISPLASFLVVPVVLGAQSTRFITDHVIAAVGTIRRFGLDVYPLAYVMLDGGARTAAEFFTQIRPVPRNQPDIVGTLSAAASYLGLYGVYLEAGSDAECRVQNDEVAAARRGSGLPVFVGGGIRTAEEATDLLNSGVTGVFVGTEIERRKDIKWLGSVRR